jgi:signal transduction histidine kinase
VLESLIREAADIVSWSAKHTLFIDCSAAPEHWNCDPALIRIALSNLLDNAVKYGGTGQVSVIATLEADNLLISVKDEGQGIPDSDQVRVFERYQRGIQVPEGKGSGLGLAVVKMIAKAHCGSISVVVQPSSGCVFELRLPYSNLLI